MSETRSALQTGPHVGSTVSRLAEGSPWRIVVHWHHDGGQLVPAGIEVRCYAVEGDDESDFQGGQEHPDHTHPVLGAGDRSRAVSSGLLGKRVHWGKVLGEHAAGLSQRAGAEPDQPGPHHAGSAALLAEVSALASGLTRATDDTYRLVAELYREAKNGPDRSRPAVAVLGRLAERHGYSLDPENPSDRVKVRQWIGEARKRGHLSSTTTSTKGNDQ